LRPGVITIDLISSAGGKHTSLEFNPQNIKSPGFVTSHYSPKAEVRLNEIAKPGDGFFALASIKTPPGAIRLASPDSIEQFAKVLYQTLRLGDKKGLKKIVVVAPEGSGIVAAIDDRLRKASSRKVETK
jgi:L-threonylcarbamoyladenylate synthase